MDDVEHERLRRLEQRLDRASEAAERLIADAAAAAARKPPPGGWQRPGSGEQGRPGADSADPGNELELLLDVFNALRDRIPPELQRRLGEAVREVLLAIRALIDWYLERTERRPDEPGGARDIPIL